jgi:pSer/pThr/pTyr-binding forkhead associated (FHA) protein
MKADMRAQLMPLDGGPAVEIAKEMTLIGRQEDCDLRLDHKSVSKMHCVLVKTDGLLLLRDLGSTNGTRVNGTRVRRAALLPNDKLSVANFHYRVLFGAVLDAVGKDEHTQRIDTQNLPSVVAKAAQDVQPDSAIDQPILEVQKNALPDVYPDDKKE